MASSEPHKPKPIVMNLNNTTRDGQAPAMERNLSSSSSGSLSHRSSIAENLRPHPPSPRIHRHPSLSHAAVQDLLNHPPIPRDKDLKYRGRDWRKIKIGEVVNREKVRWVERSLSVEEATKILVEYGPPHVVLVRDDPASLLVTGTFDFGDLNAYLLVVLGLAQPEEDQIENYTNIAKLASEGKPIPLNDVLSLAKKAPLVTLPESSDLSAAIEYFAGGTHRILITKEGTCNVIGVFSQWNLVNFLWENGSSFSVIDHLYPKILKDLDIGTREIVSINGDKPLTEALLLMNSEGLSSIAVVDAGLNVIGNISVVDVRHLTKTSSLPLLHSSCIHFLSVILMERGVENGKDAFPVFHVNPYSTLAHTVAKLVATTSQRMWVTESPSPSSSAPATPATAPSISSPSVLSAPPPSGSAITGSNQAAGSISPAFPSISAAAFPGARISGRLIGVVSLTDVLNLFSRQSGLVTDEPSAERQYRRRSESVSSSKAGTEGERSARPSMDGRGSSVDIRR